MNTINRPTVLLVGAGERMRDALADALERHRMMVETVTTERAVDAAFAAAPDLVVLLGDAARDGGHAVLERLSASPATATVPVVLLAEEAALERRLDAFRHGVVAVVPKTASADGMARRIAEVGRELPERPGETTGELGEATVDELVDLFSQQLRTGILSVSTGDSGEASAQVVLRAGRPVTEAIEELVHRLRPLVADRTGPLRYEFHESTSARLSLLDEESEPEDTALLHERRVVLVEQNPARADVLVQELRAHGALVVVADGEGTGLSRARALDPEVVVIDGSGVHGWALPTLRALRRDPRLRWASLLVVDAGELWPEGAPGPDLARLAASMKPLVRPAKELAERAARETVFDTRLDVIGPSRMLRALIATGTGLRVSVSHPRARIEVDLIEGLVAGARALAPGTGEQMAEGPAALAALLALGTGRVHVERKEAPASADVMAPIDDALAAAARERPPISPSIPPPAAPSEPPETPAAGADAEKLVGRLEELLERLQRVLPAAEAAVERVEEAPTTKRPQPAKPAPAVPPPRAGLPPRAPLPPRAALPPAGTKRRPTMALGSAARPPSIRPQADEDDDLPVIEGTAEPGPRTLPPSAQPIRAVGAPAASSSEPDRPIAEAANANEWANVAPPMPAEAAAGRPNVPPPAPASTTRANAPPSGSVHDAGSGTLDVPWAASAGGSPPSIPPSNPPFTIEGSIEIDPSFAATPAAGSPPPPKSASAGYEAPPVPAASDRWAPLDDDADSFEAPKRRSLGPLLFAGAFVLTLLIGGGVVAYLRFGGGEVESELAETTSELPHAESTPDDAPPEAAPPVPDPSTATPSGALSAAGTPDTGTPDAGPPDAGTPDAGSPDAGPPDAGPPDAGPPDAGLGDEATEGTLPDEETADPQDPLAEVTEEDADQGGSRAEQVRHYVRLANFERNRGQLRDAERHYLRVLNMDRDNPRALAGLVRLNLARHDSTGAVRWARRLAEARPRNAANHVLLGDAYRTAGNRAAAAREWRRALELRPGLSSARRRLAGSR